MLLRVVRLALITLLAAAGGVLCLAQSAPNLSDRSARVITLSGQVSVLQDSNPWALKPGDWVRPTQIVVTGADGFAVFEVTSDGSKFEVYPNSRVTFRTNPTNWKDLLEVWIGRVKVHIQRWGGHPNPNRVHTPTAVISVRGTVFDVTVDEEGESTLVLVEEGQVAVRHALLPQNEPKLVNAGEYLRVYKNQPLADKSIDRGSILQQAMRALRDAIFTAMYEVPRTAGGVSMPGGGSTGGGVPGGGVPGGGIPGDTGATPPPPPPPPPGGGNDGGSAPPPPPPPPGV